MKAWSGRILELINQEAQSLWRQDSTVFPARCILIGWFKLNSLAGRDSHITLTCCFVDVASLSDVDPTCDNGKVWQLCKDVCETATCTRNPDAKCVSPMGGCGADACKPKFYDNMGKEVQCKCFGVFNEGETNLILSMFSGVFQALQEILDYALLFLPSLRSSPLNYSRVVCFPKLNIGKLFVFNANVNF